MNVAVHNGFSAPSSPIPLLMFSNLPTRGGAEEHMLMLLRYLSRSHFKLHVALGPEVAASAKNDIPPDVELFIVKFTNFTDVAGAFHFRKILRQHQIKILHSHMFWTSMFASPVARLSGVPVIIETPHVREQWRKGWKASYRIDRAVGRCVDRYIAVSHANARYLVEEKKILQQKVTVIQNGCDLSRFNREHRAQQGMKASVGFADDDPVLLLIGRLEPQKGHTVMLQAMPAILRQFPNARLLCLGDGALRTELEQQIASLGISQSVRMLGYQTNVPDWLALADVVVLPSFFEGLPLVAIEALAAGKPVVATSVDGTPEVVMDGRTGLLVPPGDSASLAETICRMFSDGSLRETLASAGHDFVLRQFTRERQVLETEQCYLKEWQRVTGQILRTTLSHSESMEAISVG